MPDLVGQTILTQYRVEKFIAQTTLGEYYRVTDTLRNKPFGITFLPKSISNDAEALKRIETDSNRLRAITHPNLVPYIGFFQTAKHAFLLEDWIDGPSLRDILEYAPVTINEALVFLKALCSGLNALHKQGYLHLGLTPEMIHINKRGEIFISGIGGARTLRTKGFLRSGRLSARYSAPEQFNGEVLTPSADTYALATILFELTTGVWINGKSAPQNIESIQKVHLEKTPPAPIKLNPAVPDNFSRMLLWVLRKKPTDRLKTTTEILSSLSLAAGINVDEIPLRADEESAPVTTGILADWNYLPPPPRSVLADDKPPLDERLAQVTTTKPKKQRNRAGLLPALGLVLFAGFIALFMFIRPAEAPVMPTPVYFTPFVPVNFTPPPTLTSTPKPTHAPGNRIAFTCTRGDYNQICLINVDGTGFAQLSDIQASNYYPVFHPQGGSLLFSSNRNGSFDLYSISFDERELFQITDHIGNVVSPDYSPDGSRIVFANLTDEVASSIWVVNSTGLNPHMIYEGLNTIVATAWSPDGETIAYAMSRGVVNEYEIFLVDADGKNNRQISKGLLGIGGSIDWSPDGMYLLIYAGPFGDKDIFRIDLTTGEAAQLTDGGNNAAATYSPNGAFIAFNSLRNDGQADIYVMKADGTLQRRLTNNPEPDWGPQWEP
jgi:Tol biopolymer transport system component/serine/threonine protein kinase